MNCIIDSEIYNILLLITIIGEFLLPWLVLCQERRGNNPKNYQKIFYIIVYHYYWKEQMKCVMLKWCNK